MTVTYTAEVATCRGFGCFLKLLFKWRGSIYKLVWLDLVCFLFIYYFLNVIYRCFLDPQQKHVFEAVTKYCKEYSDQIPLSFVLGFYVSIVMTRWWNQYTSIPWPDSMAVFVSANIHGQDERGRLMRRTIMRYVCLCLTMVLTNVSPRVKKRFPTYQHLVDAGLMVENEKNVMDQFNLRFNSYSKHWMPIVWAASIVTRARKEGRIRDDMAVKTIIDELNKFRGQAGVLIAYDTISVPLVYTQVVTLAVYTYFMTAIMAQQWTENKRIGDSAGYVNIIDLYFPVFTTLQFFFYMGWLKVAESLINPFGEDDDDFEVNWMIDRNLQVSYMIVDEMHHNHPNLVRDQYWDEIPSELPYTLETQPFRERPPEPSTANIEIPKSSMTSVKLDEMVGKSVQSVNYKFPDNDVEANNDDAVSGIHFTTGRSYTRKGSTNSLASMAGSMPRVNTMVSSFKRMFSRDESRGQPLTPGGTGPNTPDVAQPPRIAASASTNSLIIGKYPSMKITDQVIEEVDEQMTITSMRGPDVRPTAASLFPPNIQTSKPVNVPTARNKSDYQRTQSYAHKHGQPFTFPIGDEAEPIGFLSTSAPASNPGVGTPTGDAYDLFIEDFDQETPRNSERTLATDAKSSASGDDHYEKKKISNNKEKTNRFLARSISAQQQQQTPPQQQPLQLPRGSDHNSGATPTELLLEELPRKNDESNTDDNVSQRPDNTPL